MECKALIASKMKQLFLFFALAYLLSWFIWLPLYLPVFGITGLPVLPYHHGIGGLGPLLAAFICTYYFNKQQGVKELVNKMFLLEKWPYIIIALFAPFILYCLAAGINYLQTGSWVDFSQVGKSKEFPEFNLITFLIYNLLFFGFGEEVGWRGFALPRLQQKYNALVSAAILTLFWAIWHWPAFLYRPGYVEMGMAGVIGWVLSLFTGSVLLSWLYNSTKGGLFACVVFHSAIDIAFTGGAVNTNITNIMGMLITVWGLATVVIFGYKKLSKQEKNIL